MLDLKRRVLFPSGLLIITSLPPMIGAELLLRFLPVQTGMGTVAVHAEQPLFHRRPNSEYVHSAGWNLARPVHGRINNAGFANGHDYDSNEPGPLLAIVGDSYIEAKMVPYAATVHGRLAAQIEKRGRIYSFGAAGAPLSQYIAFATHARERYHPHGFVFVIIGNDFDESFRRHGEKKGMHQFQRRSDGTVALVRNDFQPGPLREVARSSALARYLLLNLGLPDSLFRVWEPPRRYVANTSAEIDPERMKDAELAIDTFLDRLPEATQLPPQRVLFLVDGIRPELYDQEALVSVQESYAVRVREVFIERAHRFGAEVIDLGPIFTSIHRETGSVFEFPDDQHWSGKGHEVAAAQVETSRLFQGLFKDKAQGTRVGL